MPSPATAWPPRPWRYSRPAIFLHWLLAALIAFMAALGWLMMAVEHEPGSKDLFDLHQSIGLVVFALVFVRIAWRAFHPPRALPSGMPRWEVRLSALVQALLYAAMALLPVTGILGSSYSRDGLQFFGIAWPRWVAPSRPAAHQFFQVHQALVWVTVALVVLHLLGGLKHLLIDHDEVFGRMWPVRW